MNITPIEGTSLLKLECLKHNFTKQFSKSKRDIQGFCKYCVRESKCLVLQEEFIQKSKKIHNDKYNYLEVKYLNNKDKVKIECPLHNLWFFQSPAEHLSGKTGCKYCSCEKQPQCKAMTKQEFEMKGKEVHGNRFSYAKTSYKRYHDKVVITCTKHNFDFEQTPRSSFIGKKWMSYL